MAEVLTGYRPGAIGAVARLHAEYYAREWGFGVFFEAKVAAEAGNYFSRYNEYTDRAWLVEIDGAIEGSLIIDGGEAGAAEQGAHLRWFVMSDKCRGQGLGERLMAEAVQFCRDADHARVYLTTFAGLDAARRLYDRHGFTLISETSDTTWGVEVQEQLFALTL